MWLVSVSSFPFSLFLFPLTPEPSKQSLGPYVLSQIVYLKGDFSFLVQPSPSLPSTPTRPTMFSLRAAQRLGSKVTPCSQRCLSTLGRSSKSPPLFLSSLSFAFSTILFVVAHSTLSRPWPCVSDETLRHHDHFQTPPPPFSLLHQNNDTSYLYDPCSLPKISFYIFFLTSSTWC